MKYKVSFNIDVAYPKGRINRKNGDVEVNTKYKMCLEEMQTDADLKMAIVADVQPKIKTGKIFNVEITKIEKV